MSIPGMEEIEAILDPDIPIPPDVEPDLADFLPRRYMSVSQLTMYLKCPHSWELRYVQGKVGRTSARMFQGIFVHKASEVVLNERLLTGRIVSVDTATDAFSTAFEESKQLIEDWEGTDPGTVKDVGVACTRVYHKEAAHKATPIAVEKTFHKVIRTSDGKAHLPVLGRIDSVQVQAHNEFDYQAIREALLAGQDPTKPKRLHDTKVSTDKWNDKDLKNDLQFALYAGVEGIPDVQVDNIVKGRAKVPRPHYEPLTGVVEDRDVQHAVRVMEGAARSIALGHFPMTDPSNWWCDEKWCSVWRYCRGAK